MTNGLGIFETFTGMDGEPVTMYQCEHITDGTYKVDNGPNAISLGLHSYVVLCVHCMTHLRGEVLSGLVKDVLRESNFGHLVISAMGMPEGVEEGVVHALKHGGLSNAE